MSILSTCAERIEVGAARLRAHPLSGWFFRFRVQLLLACVTIVLTIWAGSGTLTPYMGSAPKFGEPCHVPVNVDHPTHIYVFRLLEGAPKEVWQDSLVLRRILYPLLAYPLTRLFGIMVGGLFTTMLIHVTVLVVFTLFIRRRLGTAAATACAWLLATYPGVSYWGGLPYGYTMIFPGCLGLAMVVWKLSEDETTLAKSIGYGLCGGIICLGYDLFLIFGPAAMLVLLWRRQYKALVPTGLALVLPVLSWLMILKLGFGATPSNSNTNIYVTIARSYLGPYDLSGWARWLTALPDTLAICFFHGTFMVLPVMYLIAVYLTRGLGLARLRMESAVLLGALALFLFLNVAPPYPGHWQLRGNWYPRFYEPLFVMFVVFVSRSFVWLQTHGSRVRRRALGLTLALGVLGNLSVVYGPWLDLPHAEWVYYRFYIRPGGPQLGKVGDKYGRRPLGICPKKYAGKHPPTTT